MDYYKIFAERLNEAMEMRDISAAELSRQTNITEPMISRYRKAQYIPRRDALERLAGVLHVSARWLAEDTDNMEDNVEVFTLDVIPAEYDFIQSYRKLTRANKSLALDFVKLLLQRQHSL